MSEAKKKSRHSLILNEYNLSKSSFILVFCSGELESYKRHQRGCERLHWEQPGAGLPGEWVHLPWYWGPRGDAERCECYN